MAPPPPLPHTLEPVAADLWQVQQHRHQLGVHFCNRMTIVRLRRGPNAGRLWVHSPVSIDDELAQQIAEIGDVAHLVSPNLAHHMFAAAAQLRYPEARTWGAPGLRDKLGQPFDEELPVDGSPTPWSRDLDGLFIPGVPRLRETVFFHRSSSSLICCDYLMNIVEEPPGPARWVWRMMGLWRGLRQSRPWRRLFTRDAEAQAVAAQHVLAWPIERILPAHGEICEERASEQLRDALAWLPQPKS